MRKIKVLLADDEPVILRGLRKLLYWNELGLEIVGEAYDGAELMKMIGATSPDLIISDISMPKYSGIDVIREIHEKYPGIKVVFISAFRDFAYAQDALHYGAIGYLVKPVNRSQLEEAVLKAVRLIGDQSQRNREKEIAVRFERSKRSESIEEQLARLTDGDRSASAFLSEMGVIARSSYMTVVFGEIDGAPDDKRSESARKLQNFSVANVLEEAVSQTGAGLYFRKGELHGILLQYDRPDEALSYVQDFHDKLNQYVKLSFTFGIGTSFETLEEAGDSAQAAIEALQSKFLTGWNRVIEGRHSMSDPDLDAEIKGAVNELSIKLASAIVGTDDNNADALLGELWSAWRSAAANGKHAAVTSVYGAISRIRQELKDYGVFTGTADDHELLAKLDRSRTFEQIAEFATAAIAVIRREAAARMGTREVSLLVQVKNHIEEHYAESITLESMAALVYMNPYYFSKFFKKHTGENFKQYLTEVRIRHGLRLLMQSELLVYEIAEQVGYNNSRQFSDMFKKRYGMLPLEYKQSKTAERKG